MNTNKKIENPENTRARHGGSNPTRQRRGTRRFKITQNTRETWVAQNTSKSTIIKSYKARFKIVRIQQFKGQSQIEGQTVLEWKRDKKASQAKQWTTNITEKTEE